MSPKHVSTSLLFLLAGAVLAQKGPPFTDTGTPLPAYRAFFRHVLFLQTKAQGASPADAAGLTGWYQNRVGLSAAEATQLQQIATAHVAAIEAVEKQAGQIIAAQRAQFPGGKIPPGQAVPPPPADLVKLQQQRDDQTTRGRQESSVGSQCRFVREAGLVHQGDVQEPAWWNDASGVPAASASANSASLSCDKVPQRDCRGGGLPASRRVAMRHAGVRAPRAITD